MRRSTVKIGAIALLTMSLMFGCGEEGDWTQPGDQDYEDTDGIPELEMALTPLATPCTYDTATKAATIVLASAEVAVVSKRSVDSALIVNGVACSTALASTVKKITVTGAAGDETLVLDYINGVFAAGSSSAVGVVVDMAGGTGDAVKIRGSKSADTISFGVDGIAINTGSSLDITTANTESYVVSAGLGNDKVYGTGGNGSGDTTFTTALTIYGGAGNDTLTGGSGDDTINGGDGNDTITGSAGDDTLNGGDGDDVFNEEAADSGSETFTGGAGVDTVDYSARTGALTITMDATGDDGESGEADTVANVEVVKGGSAADTITGGANNDTIYGGGGNDTINGGAGDDMLYGEAGDDTFNEGSAASGADVFSGGAGTDTVSYTSRSNALTITIDSTANDGESGEGDTVKTDVENVTGGSGNDTITGSSSDNSLNGGTGDDTLNGGAGNDTFVSAATDDGSDTFNGGTGTDTVDYSARTAAQTATMGDATANDGLSGEADNIGDDCEDILGGSAANTFTGNDLDNLMVGGAGDDVFNGGLGNDELFGAAGADTLNGDGGDDTIDGGAGTDVVDCGAGDGDISFEGGTACEL